MEEIKQSTIRRVAFIGSYLPRRCGIATFTNDLARAVGKKFKNVNTFTIAITDTETGYDYPEQVRFEIQEQSMEDYYRAAEYINITGVDIISLQHEYGIFGGVAGSNILNLLRQIRVPVVTTLHTVLCEPNPDQYKVLVELAELSNRLVVMSERGKKYLEDIYKIPPRKIDYIPHGIPDIPFVDPNFYKDKFDVEGKFVILTFGLLSRNKGIENVIEALPQVVEKHPEVIYLVLGATHPNVIRQDGESYRESLQDLVNELNVSQNVRFINEFVSQDKLVEYMGAADVYITPYLNPQQITSGTLAYAAGAGKAVISTPYWYAEELLAEDRGVLVPFSNPANIGQQINTLIENESSRHALRKRAYLYGREMVWSKVAQAYMETFEKARMEPIPRPRSLLVTNQFVESRETLPPINLSHIICMTDYTGMLQHAFYTLPNFQEGYTTDDNARALMLTIMLERLGENWFSGADELGTRYLSFLNYALSPQTGRFRNFMAFDRRWVETVGSEDSHGRALWGLGMAAGYSNHDAVRSVASILFNRGLPGALELSSPRAWAFTLLGINDYGNRFPGDRVATQAGSQLAQRLMDIYLSTSSPDWRWFENILTYSNATLPHALLVGGDWLKRNDMIDAGLESLRWLIQIQKPRNVFAFIGNLGFYERGGTPAQYDQQPIEAHATVAACLQAYRLTADDTWRNEARLAFGWFMGENLLGLSLYDPQTGGCRDGLQPDRVNQNEGAESTLSFHLSLLELRLFERLVRTRTEPMASINLLPMRAHLPPA